MLDLKDDPDRRSRDQSEPARRNTAAGSETAPPAGMPRPERLPFVSVIMPVRNERDFIVQTLETVLTQELDCSLEVLVSDGRSDDGTREIVESMARRDPRIRLIDNAGRIVSTGLNEAIRLARGVIVIRIDAHTTYAPDYIARCLEVLRETGADTVGGPWIARGQGYRGRAIAAAFASAFAVGGARSHSPDYEGPIDSVYLGCWRREVFERVGLFDESLVRNQDDEWNLRLLRRGGVAWQSPRIRSEYSPRESLRALFRQYLQYGFWKVAVIRKHRVPASWRHIVPGAFILVLGGLIAAVPLHSGAALLLIGAISAYLAAVLAASVWTASRKGWDLLPILVLVFPAFHFGYGIGFVAGLLRWRALTKGNMFHSLTRVAADHANVERSSR